MIRSMFLYVTMRNYLALVELNALTLERLERKNQ